MKSRSFIFITKHYISFSFFAAIMELDTDSAINNQYGLSIRFNSDGFSLSIVDESKILLSTKSVSATIASLSSDDIITLVNKEININYSAVNLIYESDNYLFIPAPIFRSHEASDYLNLQQKIAKNEIALYNSLPIWDTVNVFTIPKALPTALNQLFPNTIIEHHISYFLTDKIKTQHENLLFIWTRPKMMDIVVFKNSRLQLLNSYAYQTAEDFTYHTLNVIDQLSVNAEKCKVKLFNAEKKPELKKTLEIYLAVNAD